MLLTFDIQINGDCFNYNQPLLVNCNNGVVYVQDWYVIDDNIFSSNNIKIVDDVGGFTEEEIIEFVLDNFEKIEELVIYYNQLNLHVVDLINEIKNNFKVRNLDEVPDIYFIKDVDEIGSTEKITSTSTSW